MKTSLKPRPRPVVSTLLTTAMVHLNASYALPEEHAPVLAIQCAMGSMHQVSRKPVRA